MAIGTSAAHRAPALTRRTRRGLPVGRLRCTSDEPRRYGVHVEVFVRRQTAIVPAGIGVAPPWRGRVWVGGRRWGGDSRAIPLRRHAQIVVSDDARVPVHATYVFPPGL